MPPFSEPAIGWLPMNGTPRAESFGCSVAWTTPFTLPTSVTRVVGERPSSSTRSISPGIAPTGTASTIRSAPAIAPASSDVAPASPSSRAWRVVSSRRDHSDTAGPPGIAASASASEPPSSPPPSTATLLKSPLMGNKRPGPQANPAGIESRRRSGLQGTRKYFLSDCG